MTNPAEIEAQSVLNVCALMSDGSGQCEEATLVIYVDGFLVDNSIKKGMDNSIQVNLPKCDGTVKLVAILGRFYKGEAPCATDPSPLVISMDFLRDVRIALASYASAGQTGFDVNTLINTLESNLGVLATVSPRAAEVEEQLLSALDEGDLARAQGLANEASAILRSSNNLALSQTYSSITYIAGFRAIGIEPLSAENPLVTTIGTSAPSSVVLSPAGRSVIEAYQAERGLAARAGVWDGPTARAISETLSAPNMPAVAVPSPGLRPGDFFIDSTGRMILR